MAGKIATVASTLFVLSFGAAISNSTRDVSDSKVLDSFSNQMSVDRDEALEALLQRDVATPISSMTTGLAPRAPRTKVVEIIVNTLTMKEPRKPCGRMDEDLIYACVHKIPDDCEANDPQCMCMRLTAMQSCFDTCRFHEGLAFVQMEKNKYCNMAYAEPAAQLHGKVHPKQINVLWTAKEIIKPHATYVGQPVPAETEIVYNHHAGKVTAWEGKAGHTHIPSIVEKMKDGHVVFKTIDAGRATALPANGDLFDVNSHKRAHKNAAADLRAPGMVAAIGGAIGMMAVVL